MTEAYSLSAGASQWGGIHERQSPSGPQAGARPIVQDRSSTRQHSVSLLAGAAVPHGLYYCYACYHLINLYMLKNKVQHLFPKCCLPFSLPQNITSSILHPYQAPDLAHCPIWSFLHLCRSHQQFPAPDRTWTLISSRAMFLHQATWPFLHLCRSHQ